MKPANSKVHALLAKLERLANPANGGTPDEIDVATRKLQRLRHRFDFSAPLPGETMDIFAGLTPKRIVRRAVHVHTFQPGELDVANSVKWAIEQATGIPCIFRGEELRASASAATANKLAKVALHITESFRSLLAEFGRVQGVTASERQQFVRGLFDGMMNESRSVGERLPGGAPSNSRRKKPKQSAVDLKPRIAVHPYTLAVSLGKRIRFAAPLEEITAELARATQPAIGPGC